MPVKKKSVKKTGLSREIPNVLAEKLLQLCPELESGNQKEYISENRNE
jgi:hypothetical protein